MRATQSEPNRFFERSSSILRIGVLAFLLPAAALQARPTIRDAFFSVYPNAVGTTIDTVPSHPGHCGVCHFDFAGGGARNPYGIRLGNELPNWPNNQKDRAVRAIENEDSDADGFSTLQEVTNTTTFSNTPTFPGLTPANVGSTTGVTLSQIQGHLVPSTGGDTTPPSVTVLSPNGGGTYLGNGAMLVQSRATPAA